MIPEPRPNFIMQVDVADLVVTPPGCRGEFPVADVESVLSLPSMRSAETTSSVRP